MERRVYEETDGFKPSVIIVDEGGQSSVASLCIPLTIFTAWRALIVVGDHKQLRPTLVAKEENEASENSVISPLEMLETNRANLRFLDTQYRLAPSISYFPSIKFYGGRLRNHPLAEADNILRQFVRALAVEKGLPGSEYFLVNVQNAESHAEPGGHSLQNYANVNAIDGILQGLESRGVPASEISILTMYKAQARLILKKIGRKPDGTSRFQEGSTADAFQGRESNIVILDFVVTKALTAFGQDQENPEIAADDHPVDVYNKASSFIRDYHRINVALTRARDGLILVGHHCLFKSDRSGTEMAKTLYDLALDVEMRNLASTQHVVDDNPISTKRRADRTQAEEDYEAELRRDINKFGFIEQRQERQAMRYQRVQEGQEFNLLTTRGHGSRQPTLGDQGIDVPTNTAGQIRGSRGGRGGDGGRGGPRGGRGGDGGGRATGGGYRGRGGGSQGNPGAPPSTQGPAPDQQMGGT
ncbi:MAG: hypothetical protein Q9200_006737 [Gallowayella weberi]